MSEDNKEQQKEGNHIHIIEAEDDDLVRPVDLIGRAKRKELFTEDLLVQPGAQSVTTLGSPNIDNNKKDKEGANILDGVEEDDHALTMAKVLEQRARFLGIAVLAATNNNKNLGESSNGSENGEQLMTKTESYHHEQDDYDIAPRGSLKVVLLEKVTEESADPQPRLPKMNDGPPKPNHFKGTGSDDSSPQVGLCLALMKELCADDMMEPWANNVVLDSDSDIADDIVPPLEGLSRAWRNEFFASNLVQPGAFAVNPPVKMNTLSNQQGVASLELNSLRQTSEVEPAAAPARHTGPLEAVLVSDKNPNMEEGANTVHEQVADVEEGSVVEEGGFMEEMQSTLQVAVEEAKSQNQASPTCHMSAFYSGVILLLLVAAVTILVLGLMGFFEMEMDGDRGDTDDYYGDKIQGSNSDKLPNDLTTLERIKARGALLCYDQQPSDVFVTGLENALCQAVAAAILGVPAKVEYVEYVRYKESLDLAHEKVDLVASVLSHTMEREVYEDTFAKTGFSFSSPYLIAGAKGIGEPYYIKCLNNDFSHIGECEDIKICIESHTRNLEEVARKVPRARMVEVDRLKAQFMAGNFSFMNDCNIVMINSPYASRNYLEEIGFPQPYAISNTTLSKNPIAILTRKDDSVFSDFVNSVLQALFVAEAHGITQSSANLFPQTSLFGNDYADMFRHALQQVGNFAEIYHRTMGPLESRPIRDKINDGTNGLLYSHPFGFFEFDRDGTPLGAIMQGILDRRVLRCGVHVYRQGFVTRQAEEVTYTGMDADYCQALAAGLFEGDVDKIDFVAVHNETDGYIKLANKDIDVLSGATWTLENDVRHETTQTGFSFSKPYFYGYNLEHDNFCLATRQDDHDWSAFVYWTVEAIIFAEEHGIFWNTSHLMPEIQNFGSQRHRCFKDAIWAVGNYADMYSRNVQPYIPRGGRNELDSDREPGPLQYLLPGYFSYTKPTRV